jgi:putative aldouronate transport system permease protein
MRNPALGRKIKRTGVDILFDTVNVTLVVILTILCLYPLYYVLIYSLSDSNQVASVYLLPKGLTFDNYIAILKKDDIANAFFISASRALLGAFLSTVCTAFIAFLLTRKFMPMKRFFYRFFILSMYLNFGLIPYYVVMNMLGFKNSYLLYIVPGAINAFNILLTKVYLESLPVSLFESAEIDGAGVMTTFFRISIPLSVPILTTVLIFGIVGGWNAWMDNLLLVRDAKLKTLQLLLMEYLNAARSVASSAQMDLDALKRQKISPATIRCAISIITIVPIAIVYPFMQKYYTQGIMLGAIKG